jgi:NADH dehydrogenase
MRVVIIGGGYGGLACAIALRHKLPDGEIHLIDAKTYHIKLTHLHETLRHPLADYCVPFTTLSQRFGIIHHHTNLAFCEQDLADWQWRRTFPLLQGDLSFDYLIIATGAQPRQMPKQDNVYDRDDFCTQEGREIIKRFLQNAETGERHISVLGAGATGLQFLFELRNLLKQQPYFYPMRLIDRGDKIFPTLPNGFHKYIKERLTSAGIDYIPQTSYIDQQGNSLHLENIATGDLFSCPSGLTLLFPGVVPTPSQIQANRYGQVMVGKKTLLPNIFAVGDCSYYSSSGLNALTAQAAVRKGKQIAENIKRLQQKRLPYMYTYDELGYFVSLGSSDGIGWLLFKHNIIKGLAAFAIKQTIELQYDLFVDGLDLYV